MDEDAPERRGAEDEALAVAAANAAFYAAFEARDLDAMADVWERSTRATCTHPGWPTLHGWVQVLGSWEAIFRNTPWIQFVLTDEVVEVEGDTAWVTVTENILQGESVHASSAAALNMFVRRPGGDGWRLVVHHGSPMASTAE